MLGRWTTVAARTFVAALVMGLLAGCASPAAEPAPPSALPQADFEELDLKAGTGRGIVRGVVVDLSLTPLSGVEVALGDGLATTTTDEEGRFGFSDVEPGILAVEASKPGFAAARATVEVVADELEPRMTTLLLERLAGMQPYVVVYAWDGFMQCSFTAAGVFATGCLVGDYTEDNSRHTDSVQGTPQWLQSELVWTPTQVLGSSLCMRHYARGEESAADFEMLVDDVCGTNPVVQQADVEHLNATGVGTGRGIERVVWVSGYEGAENPGLAFNQRFSVYTHLFYNFVPDPAWRFSVDGDPPMPPT